MKLASKYVTARMNVTETTLRLLSLQYLHSILGIDLSIITKLPPIAGSKMLAREIIRWYNPYNLFDFDTI